MKVLSFDTLFFKLPDDFEGGLGEALRAMADYHDAVANTPKQEIGGELVTPPGQTLAAHREEQWDDFWTMIHESDRRVSGAVGIHEYLGDGEPGTFLGLNAPVRKDK